MRKRYTFKADLGRGCPQYIKDQWEIIKPLLQRQGYRIEVVKIKMGIFSSKIIYEFKEIK